MRVIQLRRRPESEPDPPSSASRHRTSGHLHRPQGRASPPSPQTRAPGILAEDARRAMPRRSSAAGPVPGPVGRPWFDENEEKASVPRRKRSDMDR